jgi:hypothetical protein
MSAFVVAIGCNGSDGGFSQAFRES